MNKTFHSTWTGFPVYKNETKFCRQDGLSLYKLFSVGDARNRLLRCSRLDRFYCTEIVSESLVCVSEIYQTRVSRNYILQSDKDNAAKVNEHDV